MSAVIAIVASIAIAGGVSALVGILIAGSAPRAKSPRPEIAGPVASIATGPATSGPAAARSAGSALVDIAPRGYLGWLDRKLVLAGWPKGWTIERIITAKPMLTVALGIVAFLYIVNDPVPLRIGLGAFVVILAFFVPDLLILSRAQERQEKMQLALPDTLDQMTISVEAGLGFESAMSKAGTNGIGPLADELIRTLQDMSIGRSRRDAYEALGARTSSEDLRRFTKSVIQADMYGIAIADVLRVQAAEMRLKRRQRAEEKAMKVPVKVLFPLIFCILPVLFIVLLTPAVLSMIESFG